MKRGYTDTKEGQIHYITEGYGEPLLLLHQVGLSSDQFKEMIPYLSPAYRVLAMDIPGYGSSYLPVKPYSIEDYGRSVVQFLDSLEIKKAHILGRLFGGDVAVEVAVTHPDRVGKLVLSGCANPDPAEQKRRLAMYGNKRMVFKEDGSHIMDVWKDHLSRPHKDLETCQRAAADYLKSGLGTRTEDGHIALFSYDFGARLPKIKSPTLLLYCSGDTWLKQLDDICKLIPGGRKNVIPGTGAFPTWEKPEEIARAVIEFLQTESRVPGK